MDIDFLKRKNPQAIKKEVRKDQHGIDYTKPGEEKKKSVPVKKEKAPKVSFWKRIKNIFKRQPKESEPTKSYPYAHPPAAPMFVPPLPLKKIEPKPAPLPPPKPKPMPILPKPEPKKIAVAPVAKKPLIQPDKEGIVAQPALANKDSLTALNKKDLEKIKKGEYAKGFLDVNLLPGKKTEAVQPVSKIRGLLWAAIASMAFVLVVSGGMIIYQATLLSKVNDSQKQINALKENILEYEPWQKEAIAFNQKVEDIVLLLDKHIYWTNFFALLEQYTLPDVHYSSLSGDVSGTFTLSATAPDYETVSQQIALFKQADFISKVSVVSASMSTESLTANVGNANANANTNTTAMTAQPISFNISLTVKPEIFYYGRDL